MIGWRDGKPNGVEVYDPLNEDTPVASGFTFQASGNTLTASIPLTDIGLTPNQTVALSAFQEGASDDWTADWVESAVFDLNAGIASQAPVATIDDPVDMADSSGDLKRIEYTLDGGIVEVRLPLSGLGLVPGQTIAVSAFQEGQSDNWSVDWVESAVLTLSETGQSGISLESFIVADAYGFEIDINDATNSVAQPAGASVSLDGAPLTGVVATKTNGVTTVTGKFASLLAANSTHTLRLSLNVDGQMQSRDFVFNVPPYTVLSTADRLTSVVETAGSRRGLLRPRRS